MIRHEGQELKVMSFIRWKLKEQAKSRGTRKVGVKVPANGIVSYVEQLIND